MYKLLDWALELLHLFIIGFNMLGWIWPRSRPWHLLLVAVTLFSWLVLGFHYGWGYCFITEWHWNVKSQRGITKLPPSYIEYLLERIFARDFSSVFVSSLTVISYGLAVSLSLFLYLKSRRKKPQS